MRLLRHQGVVAQGRDGRLTLTRAGLDADALETLLPSYRDKRESDRAMLERMVFYGQTGRLPLEGAARATSARPSGFASCGDCDNCVRIAAAFAAAERERDAAPVDADGAGATAAEAATPAGAASAAATAAARCPSAARS